MLAQLARSYLLSAGRRQEQEERPGLSTHTTHRQGGLLPTSQPTTQQVGMGSFGWAGLEETWHGDLLPS